MNAPDTKITKTDGKKTATQIREERDEWMRKPISNTDVLVMAIKDVEVGLAQVSEQRVDGARIARMVHLCKLAAQKNPAILECTRGSLVWSLLDAARIGLEPDGEHGALVPYKAELRFQPMYKGLIHLIAEAGICDEVDAVAVFKGDHYKCVRGTAPRIDHEPDPSAARGWGDLIACYCVLTMRNGRVKFDEMNKAEIQARRDMSRAKSGPWQDWPVEMAKKTVVKRAIKTLPRVSQKIVDAVDMDNRADQGHTFLSSEDDRIQISGLRATATTATNRGNAALAAQLGAGLGSDDKVPPPADDGETLGAPAKAKEPKAKEQPPPPEVIDPPKSSGTPPPNNDDAEITSTQRDQILGLCDRLGAVKPEDRQRALASIVGHEVSAVGALTRGEAEKAIEALRAEISKKTAPAEGAK